MSNIIDYINWRGDLDFTQSPFNEIDNLIFTQIAYIDFDNIVSEDLRTKISLKDAWESYKDKPAKKLGAILPDEIEKLFEKMANAQRYKNMFLSGFANYIDEAKEKQFSALCISGKGFVYVAYRGTDDTLVGWKEDFKLGYMDSVPSHIDSLRYLNNAMHCFKNMPVYVGGHSKGGNLAIYAAINTKRRYKRRIKNIYNNDGPGFSEKIAKSTSYINMQEKIISIVPEGSVVGQLLNHGENDIIVKNEGPLLAQHNAFSWEVEGNAFVTVDRLHDKSILADNIIKSWLADMSKEEKERFVQNVYDVFTVSNAKTLTDISNDKMGFIKALSSLDKETVKDILRIMKKIAEHAAKTMINKK